MLNQPLNLSSVNEWAPLKHDRGTRRGAAGRPAMIFLLVAVRRSELFFDELLLLAIGTWMAVSHMRMLFLFGILAAPILSRQLSTSWRDTTRSRIASAPTPS